MEAALIGLFYIVLILLVVFLTVIIFMGIFSILIFVGTISYKITSIKSLKKQNEKKPEN